MMRLAPEDAARFVRAVQDGQGRADLSQRILAIYSDLASTIHLRQPRCDVSGRCCRFEAHGHRLFVTTLEFAAFVAQTAPIDRHWDGMGCPYQVDGLCSVHPVRPFGCRVYFCDPTARDWQETLYEHIHAQIKRLHEDAGIEYFYVEWRDGLSHLGWAQSRQPDHNQPGQGPADHRQEIPGQSSRTTDVSTPGAAGAKLTVLRPRPSE